MPRAVTIEDIFRDPDASVEENNKSVERFSASLQRLDSMMMKPDHKTEEDPDASWSEDDQEEVSHIVDAVVEEQQQNDESMSVVVASTLPRQDASSSAVSLNPAEQTTTASTIQVEDISLELIAELKNKHDRTNMHYQEELDEDDAQRFNAVATQQSSSSSSNNNNHKIEEVQPGEEEAASVAPRRRILPRNAQIGQGAVRWPPPDPATMKLLMEASLSSKPKKADASSTAPVQDSKPSTLPLKEGNGDMSGEVETRAVMQQQEQPDVGSPSDSLDNTELQTEIKDGEDKGERKITQRKIDFTCLERAKEERRRRRQERMQSSSASAAPLVANPSCSTPTMPCCSQASATSQTPAQQPCCTAGSFGDGESDAATTSSMMMNQFAKLLESIDKRLTERQTALLPPVTVVHNHYYGQFLPPTGPGDISSKLSSP